LAHVKKEAPDVEKKNCWEIIIITKQKQIKLMIMISKYYWVKNNKQ